MHVRIIDRMPNIITLPQKIDTGSPFIPQPLPIQPLTRDAYKAYGDVLSVDGEGDDGETI